MIHTQNCTKEQTKKDKIRHDYYDERNLGEEGYYTLTRKELLHNLLMVYQSSFSDGKYNASLKALQLYGKEIGLFQKRKAYPLCFDDLTAPEIQEMMTGLSDMYPEDEAEMEIKAAEDFYKSTKSTSGFDFPLVPEGITPDDADQEQSRHGDQYTDQEEDHPVTAQAVDQFSADAGKRGLQRPQGCKQGELCGGESQVTKSGQIDKEGCSTHPASDIFNSNGAVQHGQAVADNGHNNEHQVRNCM